jgi:hypothetical protein
MLFGVKHYKRVQNLFFIIWGLFVSKDVAFFGTVRYQTGVTDARMLMPLIVFWMPMPTFVFYQGCGSGLTSIRIPIHKVT